MATPKNYRWPETREADRKYREAEYSEKQSLRANSMQTWHWAVEDPPPVLTEVIATDGRNVKEAWLSRDGQWIRINEKWERVFGDACHVILWTEKPEPPKEYIYVNEKENLSGERAAHHPDVESGSL